MKVVKDILKGIIIGIANIVPGVSGGTLAVSMGIYETLIGAVNNIFKTPIKVIKMVWPYVLGVILGAILSVYVIGFLFELAPIPTAMLFVGWVLGALPMLLPKVQYEELHKRDVVVFGIMAAIILFMPALAGDSINVLEPNFITYIIMFGIGIIIAMTMIVPGVSGSMVLMALGYYVFTLDVIKNTISAILSWDISMVIYGAKILIPLAIGAVAGILVMAKVIEKLLAKYPRTVYWGIIGLICTSPFPIILNLDLTSVSAIEAIISAALLAVGIYTAQKLAIKEEE